MVTGTDAPREWSRANRQELIALVVRQREQIAEPEQEVARLRADLATQRAETSRSTIMPGLNAATHAW